MPRSLTPKEVSINVGCLIGDVIKLIIPFSSCHAPLGVKTCSENASPWLKGFRVVLSVWFPWGFMKTQVHHGLF